MTHPTSKYDPRDRDHRRTLATELLALFARALFIETTIEGTKERVFAREVPNTDGKIRVLVYSTIEGDMTRAVAKDAIRVCVMYRSRDGRERGIASAQKRVNRTGVIDAITKRVILRMRDCWAAVISIPRCHCGAPKFVSKVRTNKRTGVKTGGNQVCADLCWKTAEDLNRSNQSYQQPRRGRSQGRGSYRRW
jgi:hypothetical protein